MICLVGGDCPVYARGMPAGMTMMSASLKAALAPSLAGR
jgi:hypothetical protein